MFQFDDQFWRDSKNWPHDRHEYAFLARAFHAIGRAVFADSWVESRDDNEPDEPEEPDDNCDAETEDRYELAYENWERACAQAEIDFENMWDSIARKIAEACEAGTLVSAIRAKEGGKMIQLDADDWNTENFAVRFRRCDISLTNPFATSRSDRSHWIYVNRDSLDSFLEQMPAIDLVAQPSEGLHQAGSNLSTGSALRPREDQAQARPQESEARIRAELKTIYADPVNDRPNMEEAWKLLHAKLPNARKKATRPILREAQFASQRRKPGNQPKS